MFLNDKRCKMKPQILYIFFRINVYVDIEIDNNNLAKDYLTEGETQNETLELRQQFLLFFNVFPSTLISLDQR